MPMDVDANDIVGNSPCTITGTTPSFPSGQFGNRLFLESADTAVTYTKSSSTGQMSVAFWYWGSGNEDYQKVIDMGSVGRIGTGSPGSSKMGFNLYPVDLTGNYLTVDFSPGHIVWTYDGNDMKVYNNGSLIGELLGINSLSKPMTSLEIGPDDLTFYIDEVKVYNYGLSECEAGALYLSYLPPQGPDITTQPDSATVESGTNVTFSIVAYNPYTCDDTGMTYAWTKDSVVIVGEESPSLEILGADSDDDGIYQCEVTLTANDETTLSNAVELDIYLPNQIIIDAPMDGDVGDDALPASTTVSSPTGETFDFVASSHGQALHVDGTASSPAVGYTDEILLDTGEVSLSFWIANVSPYTKYDVLGVLGNWSDSTNVIKMMTLYGPTFSFIFYNDSGEVNVESTFHAGGCDPTHVVLTYDKATVRIYVNGELDVSAPLAGEFLNEGPLYIGARPNETPNFTADWDEVKLYNYALNTDQIAYLYDGQMVCTDPPLYDTNDDCVIDLDDFAAYAGEWLYDGSVAPTFP